jgi:Tol biopolymer transport system component
MAVTLRGRKRATMVYEQGGQVQRIGDGCQLSWSPDSSYLYYVDKGGRMQNAIYKVASNYVDRDLWLDLPGDYSHEYFPKVSPKGLYLVLGACSKGHEHDTADYEIFLWQIGTPPQKAVRVSFHTANDCWPDIYLR